MLSGGQQLERVGNSAERHPVIARRRKLRKNALSHRRKPLQLVQDPLLTEQPFARKPAVFLVARAFCRILGAARADKVAAKQFFFRFQFLFYLLHLRVRGQALTSPLTIPAKTRKNACNYAIF